MNPFSRRDFKYEKGKKNQPQEQEYVFEASVDRLVGICHLDERDAQSSCIEPADRANWSFSPCSPGNERYRPLRAETVAGNGSANRQKPAIKPWAWPASPHRQMSGLAVSKHCNPLGT